MTTESVRGWRTRLRRTGEPRDSVPFYVFPNTSLIQATVHIARPVLTYVAIAQGGGPFEVGLLAAGFALGPLAVAIPLGRQADKHPEGWFFFGGSLLATGALLALSTTSSIALLMLFAVALGIGQMASAIGGQSLVGKASPVIRDRRLSHYALFVSLGQMIGPLVGGFTLVHAVGYMDPNRAAFLVAACLGVVATAIAWRKRSATTHAPVEAGAKPKPKVSTWSVLRRPGMTPSLLACLAVVSTVDVVLFFLPLIGEKIGLSPGAVGALLAVRAGSAMVSRLFVARMMERLGHRQALVYGMVLAAGCIAAVPFVSWVPGLVVLMAVIGVGLGLGQPVTLALVASRGGSERALAMSLWQSGNRLSIATVPLLVGALAGPHGVEAVYVTMGIWILAAGVLVFLRLPRRMDEYA